MKNEKFDLIVIGGGASGFFGAIQAATRKKGLNILIVEKSSKLLSKVRISGGGRCNVTNQIVNPFDLARHYPRGEKALKQMFKSFATSNVVDWFEQKGVKLKTEADGRMFPVSDSSSTIIDCFLYEAESLGITVQLNFGVSRVEKNVDGFELFDEANKKFTGKKILIAMGGHPNRQNYQWIADLGHTIIPPIPSLFTFNDKEKKLSDLMGISMPDAEVKIEKTKLSQQGPVLITHWGLSGPAVIKLSAWAAADLHQRHYEFNVFVSWIGSVKEEDIRKYFTDQKAKRPKQKVITNNMFSIPQRLWQRLCELSEIEDSKIWGELAQKNINKLIENLIRCQFQIRGKTTFKEEFVTCGGVDLKDIDTNTMESRLVHDMYFAGEVLNIDGETGGFNFQAAWTTAYLAAQAITT